jgi:hypothetical protein
VVKIFWFGAFIDIDFVLSQLSWDTWHVGRLPSEDIFVVLKKVGERKFLFSREVGTYGRYLYINFFLWCKDARFLSWDLALPGSFVQQLW